MACCALLLLTHRRHVQQLFHSQTLCAGAMKWPYYAFCEGAFADGDVIAKRLKTPMSHETASQEGGFHTFARCA